MRAANLAFVLEEATRKRKHAEPFADAVAASIEVGVVVPSILRRELEARDFKVVEDDAALAEFGINSMNTLKRSVVVDGDVIVAMGAAGDHAEALLHAALGWFREHPTAESEPAPEGIGEAPGT